MKRDRPALSLAFWVFSSLITLFPIYWMFVVSAKSRVELFGAPSFIIKSFFSENYWATITNTTYQGFMFNSIVIATSNALLVTTLSLFATYALSRYPLVGKENVFFWTITNRMAPPAAFLLPLFLLYTQVFVVGDWKMFDTRIGLILLYCVFNLPFAIWTMRGVIDAIPHELDEAAYVDGAKTWQVLFHVITPLARPGLAVTAILTWVFAWNEYLFAMIFTSGADVQTLPVGLTSIMAKHGTNYAIVFAAMTISALPIVIMFFAAQRYFIRGLAEGIGK